MADRISGGKAENRERKCETFIGALAGDASDAEGKRREDFPRRVVIEPS
jgi:hypothetical protein